jgi:peptide/nickel transport system substrate-binding protein
MRSIHDVIVRPLLTEKSTQQLDALNAYTFVVAKDANNGYYFPSIGAVVHLYLNTTKAPFDKVEVRKAISQAIDRDQIVTVAMYDYTKPADVTGLSDAYPGFKSQAIVDAGAWTKLDVDAANAALDAAGLARGADGIRVNADGTPMKYEINVVSGWTDWVSACEIMAQNFGRLSMPSVKSTFTSPFSGTVISFTCAGNRSCQAFNL